MRHIMLFLALLWLGIMLNIGHSHWTPNPYPAPAHYQALDR